MHDAVFYAVNPDRFARDPEPSPHPWDDGALEPWDAPPAHRAYKGGTLRGLAARLDHLLALGVDALYLTPIWPSTTHHRYKPIDHLRVEPLLGGDAAFDALLAAAHARGLRVVLDGVFNHVGLGFPPFLDVLEYGERSPWRRWFRIAGWPLSPFDPSRPANYACWNGNRTMPELAHDHPPVREHVLSVVEHWLRRGVDGWRFDAPAGVGDVAFWRELRRRARAVRADAYLLGECWTDASAWLDGTQWDGATNYPLMGAIHRFAAGARIRPEHLVPGTPPQVPLDAAGFAREVEGLVARHPWPIPLAQLDFLGTHDTARFLTVAGGDRASVELGALLLFTLPGAPCLYAGDEVGMQGGLPPASRGGYPSHERWDLALLDLHRRLAAVRRANAPLRRGTLRPLHAAGDLLVFERVAGGETVIVAVNAGTAAARASVPLPRAAPPCLLEVGAAGARASGGAGAPLEVVVPGRSGVVLGACRPANLHGAFATSSSSAESTSETRA
ncbi:neopullulanase [Anaeromyxobacter oryzae]|uniref:Neopullulanase n=1 Tax=Anaeromyxobacter oryzae TaxID=2918170 RepID=A0ABM7WPK0_9BACT|nr:neopullulanase [Anaeromyxobacter oryzae]